MPPLLALTMGDINGIGPEVVARAAASAEVADACRLLIVGSADVLRNELEFLDIPLAFATADSPGSAKNNDERVTVLDMDTISSSDMVRGQVSSHTGKAAMEWIEEAARLAVDGTVDAIVTAPICKEAINKAGYQFAGHTDFIAHLTHSKEYRMMLVVDHMRVLHNSLHVSVEEACGLVTRERVLRSIILAERATRRLTPERQRLAVAALNPHAGEKGLFGNDDEVSVRPAVEEAKSLGIDVTGPLPPDTVFHKMNSGEFDAVVAMYHDQGHIPLKLLGFERGVNITIGLPIVRTSVDHGTAFDIVGQGKADPGSMVEAIKLALKLCKTD